MHLPPKFSQNPGAWEQHLQRKYRNPLFPEAAQIVVQHQVIEARERDQAEQKSFQQSFTTLVKEISELPKHVETDQLLDLLGKLDALYEECSGLGVSLPKEKEAIRKLNIVFRRTLENEAAKSGDNAEFLQQLQNEAAAREIHYEMLDQPLFAILMRKESPISADDLAATLLSESLETVEKIIGIFDLDQQILLARQVEELLGSIKIGGLPENALEIADLLKTENAKPQFV